MPFRACTLLYHEEAKSVSFEAIFSHDDDQECKIWRELLRHRTIMLLEAAWRYLLDTKSGFLTKAGNEVWRTSLKDFGGTDLEEVRGVDEVPSVPDGHLGTRRRHQGDAPSMSTDAYNEDCAQTYEQYQTGIACTTHLSVPSIGLLCGTAPFEKTWTHHERSRGASHLS